MIQQTFQHVSKEKREGGRDRGRGGLPVLSDLSGCKRREVKDQCFQAKPFETQNTPSATKRRNVHIVSFRRLGPAFACSGQLERISRIDT
jgi:hypothetical protein